MLKPCPFCSGEADVMTNDFYFQVECGQCGARSKRSKECTNSWYNDVDGVKTWPPDVLRQRRNAERQVRRAWNRRPTIES